MAEENKEIGLMDKSVKASMRRFEERQKHRAERRPIVRSIEPVKLEPEAVTTEPEQVAPAALPPKEPPVSPEERPKRPIKKPELKLDPWMTSKKDIVKPEVVQPREWQEGIPNYGQFDNINQTAFAIRRQLNDAIMRNGWIRPDNDEDLAIRGWIRQAENLAKETGDKKTKEWRIYKDLEAEYHSIKECLAWWHDGVLSHVESAGKGFPQMQNRGTDFTAERIKWLMTGYRGKEFKKAFGKQCPMFEVAPSEEKQKELAEKGFNAG